MRRNLIIIAGALSLITGGIIIAPQDTSAIHAEERARVWPNLMDEVMITKIVPSEPRLELTYNNIDPIYSANDGWPRLVTIGYGNVTDMDLYRMPFLKFNQYNTTNHATLTNVAYFQAEEFIKPKWTDGATITVKTYAINRAADLVDGSEGRISYKVTFAGSEQVLLGRADYSRCINSTAFRTGVATECWMEEIGDGRVQYQPYTSAGVRVEISPEEDAILTSAENAWIPEYGWPDLEPEPEPEPEPIVEPEPEPEPIVEPEPEPGPVVEPEPEPEPIVEPEPEPIVEPEPEPEPILEPEPVVEPEPEKKDEPEVILAGVKEQRSDDGLGGNLGGEEPEREVVMTEQIETTGGTTDENGSGVSTTDTATTTWIATTGTGVTETTKPETNDASVMTMSTQNDDVEVPELGQKTDKKPNIALSIALISGIGAALVAAWWLLLFGKRKSKERKEGKE